MSIRTREGDTIKCEVHLRPFARECLTQVSSMFHVGVFTASSKEYADAIIDQVIDPAGTLLKFRLYREHCFQTADGIYMKDLRVITSHGLHEVLLVDNSVHSFGLQLTNGIPIVPYFDDPADQELVHLSSYVLSLAGQADLRTKNASTF